MKHVAVFDHRTNRRVAFLDKAYDIGYSLEHNALWSARFTLPLSDPKNRHCRYFNYVEIHDGEKYIGLFRIVPTKLTKTENTKDIVYECEHVLATLMDDVLFGWHEIGNIGIFTHMVLRYVIDRQIVKRWQLGVCDFQHQFLYGWENENLLSALLSIPRPFREDYKWDYDTSVMPWTISLKKAPATVKAEIRYQKNMIGIEKFEDPTNICTRLYPLGYGEGDNQLHIAAENNGKKYLDADTQNEYGIISKIWVDQRYQDAKSLYDAAVAMLDELKRPTVSYTVKSIHSKELKQRDIGDFIRVIDDEAGIDIYTRIVAIEKADITGAPDEATITIANLNKSVAANIADLSDRQRINETYAQGAVTLFTTHFYDNCSPQQPADLRFFVPDNVVHLNQVILAGRAVAFRGYSQATKGGGARTDTTSSGGGTYTSTESGGAGTPTSNSGGGTTTTSSGSTLVSSNTVTDYSDDGGQGGANHNHGFARDDRFAIMDMSGSEIIGYRQFVPSGKHTHPSHSHQVTIQAHNHSVTLPSHTHGFSVPAHQHSFAVPDHTHDIEYGIFRGTTAKALHITVDGKVAGDYGANILDLNLIELLSRDGSGNVNRGWHTIQIKPDILTRVELDLIIQLFANSRGGGQY